SKPYLVSTAFPGFHDIYREAGNGTGYGFLDDYEGQSFKLPLEASVAARSDVIQIATWNAYGEGTIVEPTVERGYRDLELLLDLAVDSNPSHPFTKGDLRIPLELHRLRAIPGASEERLAAVDSAYAGLFAGDMGAFRRAVADA